MYMSLLSSFGKQGVELNLLSLKVDIEDTTDKSKYFVVSEIDTVFTAGRNPVAFNGSAFLKDGSEVQIECLDSNGSPMYIEQAKSKVAQYTDVSNFVISVHVYGETYNGPGKLVFVGNTTDDKIVRWVKNIAVDKTISNSAKVRFYNKPTLEIRPLLYPVVDLHKADAEDKATKYSQATATANITSYVDTITLRTSGEGYTGAPTVTIDPPSDSTGTRAYASATVADGKVTNIVITSPGSKYSSNPGITISGGGATTDATAVTDIKSFVDSVTMVDNGSGYDFIPNVKFTGGSGYGATGIAEILDGQVIGIDVTDTGGDGYISPPIVTIEDPTPTTPSDLNVSVSFSCDFYAQAIDPKPDTNQYLVNKKRTEIDYRIFATGLTEQETLPILSQTGSFNIQMEGVEADLTITKIQLPLSHRELDVNISSKVKIKKVLDSTTIKIEDPIYYQVGNNKFITNIVEGNLSISYNFVKYNTSPDSSLTIQPDADGEKYSVKESYVEATYRNLKPYSGFVARHKLYRRSLFYPGEFQLISDEPLNSVELLTDTITFNRKYYEIGKFYHQFHIQKYWFTSSNNISVTASATPLINSMKINGGSPGDMDGSEYVMVKTDTIGGSNDNVYYPYNALEFNQLSGSSYDSNFINLKKDSLYMLSVETIVEKDEQDQLAKLGFYFTSSIEDIKNEESYDPVYGWKIGEIPVTEKTPKKFFKEPQKIFFTPTEDYYGTLKIVPYHCNVTIANLSIKAYGDQGYSPEVQVIRVPCPLNVANEAFEFKAELYDIDLVLIPSDLGNTTTFDPSGASLYGDNQVGNAIYVTNNGNVINTTSETITISGEMYLPDLPPVCSLTDYHRLVAWNGVNGALVRTPIINVSHDDEYITLRTGSCDSLLKIPVEGKSLNVVFDGLTGGRQIYWTGGTTKQIDS